MLTKSMKAADENASSLALYIGKTGLLRCERVSVEVTIADAKRSYGRTLLLVRPVSGTVRVGRGKPGRRDLGMSGTCSG